MDTLAIVERNLMTASEARQATEKIKNGLAELRQLFYEIYKRDGWQVLGYKNITQYAKAELGYSSGRAYQLIEAAETEQNLRFSTAVENRREIVQIPERQLRELAELPANVQPVVYQKAVDTAPNGKVTAAHIAKTAKEYQQEFEAIEINEPEEQPEEVEQAIDVSIDNDEGQEVELNETEEMNAYFFSLFQDGEKLYNQWWDAELSETREKYRKQLCDLMVRIDQERG